MMCSIRKCKSRSVKGGGISFFSFPRDESVANEWLRHCGPKTTTKRGRVCSKHFVPSDYSKPLRCILLNYSPKHARQLKPDAVPTLHLDGIDKEITPEMMINVKNEIISTTENMNCLPAIAANEVVGCSEVIENSPIKDKQNPPNMKVEIEILPNTENIQNCLPQCNTIPANGVAGLYKYLVKRPINDKQNTSNVMVQGGNQIILTTENVNSPHLNSSILMLPQFITIPAKEAVGSSKVSNKSDESSTISLAEHRALVRSTNELKNLKSNLAKIFTPGQIRCLTKPSRRRVVWSAEDIAAAISLRRKSPQGYRFMRVTVGIPFPGCSTLRKWEAKHKNRQALSENVVKVDHTYAE